MKKVTVSLLLLVLLLVACNGGTVKLVTATPSLPTPTLVPPTGTPVPLAPTNTPVLPTDTLVPTATPTATDTPIPPTATATPTVESEIWQPRDTSQDPINWNVFIAEDMGGGVVRYALPPEIQKIMLDEIEEIAIWQTKYISAVDAKTLAQHVDTYYAEPLLTTMKKLIDTLARSGQVGIEYDKQPPPYNLPPLAIEGVLPDGKTAYVRQTRGAYKMDFFNADGSPIEGMSTAEIPAQQFVYRVVFNTELRRWQLAEQVEGPITLPEPIATVTPESTTGHIFGVTFRSDTGENLSGLKVVLIKKEGGTPRYGQTDMNGKFEFEDIVPGDYRLEVQADADKMTVPCTFPEGQQGMVYQQNGQQFIVTLVPGNVNDMSHLNLFVFSLVNGVTVTPGEIEIKIDLYCN